MVTMTTSDQAHGGVHKGNLITQLPPPSADLIQKLIGTWLRTTDNAFMGEVMDDGKIKWNDAYNHAPCALKVTEDYNGNVEVMVEVTGCTHVGWYDEAEAEGFANGRLRWNDGEVWRKSPKV